MRRYPRQADPSNYESGRLANLKALLSAYRNSIRGLELAARSERAFRQQLIVLAAGVPAALIVSDQLWTRVTLIGVLLLVLVVELLNTAIEKLCDHVTPDYNPAVGAVKDFGSAAVFCTLALALLIWGAAIVGLWLPSA